MKRIRVEITEQDLLDGVACSPENCPVSRYLKKKFKVKVRTQIRTVSWWVDRNDIKTLHFYKLSKNLIKFVDDYDYGREAKPGTYYIEKV